MRTHRLSIALAGAAVAVAVGANGAMATGNKVGPPADDNNPCKLNGHRKFFGVREGGNFRIIVWPDGYVAVEITPTDQDNPGYFEVDGAKRQSEGYIFLISAPDGVEMTGRNIGRKPSPSSTVNTNLREPFEEQGAPVKDGTVPELLGAGQVAGAQLPVKPGINPGPTYDSQTDAIADRYEAVVPESMGRTPNIGGPGSGLPLPNEGRFVTPQQKMIQYNVGTQGNCVSVSGVRVV